MIIRLLVEIDGTTLADDQWEIGDDGRLLAPGRIPVAVPMGRRLTEIIGYLASLHRNKATNGRGG